MEEVAGLHPYGRNVQLPMPWIIIVLQVFSISETELMMPLMLGLLITDGSIVIRELADAIHLLIK
jgi:hypothetical protein